MNQTSVGVVVIGRNEGERLRACLTSLQGCKVGVYIDSGSVDGSCALARSLGFAAIDLDTEVGFTAARARNAGIAWLTQHHPDLLWVQMVDGDCEVQNDWFDAASADLEADPSRAVVFGRRRELYPDRNAYHRACDDEWNVALGEVNSCGGDALFRIAALREVSGYNGSLIAGEEPEMCLRLRERGWRIWSNGHEMTWHDVAIDRFEQWWKRGRRTGFAIAELVQMYGNRSDPSWRRLLRSALGWTAINLAILPLLLFFLLSPNPQLIWLALLLPLLSMLQILRLAHSKRSRYDFRLSLQWALLIMAAKAAQACGWLQYKSQVFTRRRTTLIEYKAPAPFDR